MIVFNNALLAHLNNDMNLALIYIMFYFNKLLLLLIYTRLQFVYFFRLTMLKV